MRWVLTETAAAGYSPAAMYSSIWHRLAVYAVIAAIVLVIGAILHLILPAGDGYVALGL